MEMLCVNAAAAAMEMFYLQAAAMALLYLTAQLCP